MFSKSFIVGIIVLVVGSVSLFAQCPAGWSDGGSVTVSMGFDCEVTANFCTYDGVSIQGVCDIHFTDIIITGEGCSFPQDQYGYDQIDWKVLVDAILNSPQFSDCLGTGDIPLCIDEDPKPVVRVSNGGCYEKIVTTIPPSVTYSPCNVNDTQKCRAIFEFCRVFDPNQGIYVIESTLVSSHAAFDCSGLPQGCNPFCLD